MESTSPTQLTDHILTSHHKQPHTLTPLVFQSQCRALSHDLSPHFRLLYANGPFPSAAGPDVTTVYGDSGPFRRWFRWLPEHPQVEPWSAIRSIQESLDAAVEEDDRRGATGEVVGLLGFSQGAKLAASLLLAQQWRGENGVKVDGGEMRNYRFAVLLAGRAPLVAFHPGQLENPNLVDANHSGDQIEVDVWKGTDHVLRMPNLHVHGLKDPGLELHRKLWGDYCDDYGSGRARMVIWDGGHRVPILKGVVGEIVEGILGMARETGVLDG